MFELRIIGMWLGIHLQVIDITLEREFNQNPVSWVASTFRSSVAYPAVSLEDSYLNWKGLGEPLFSVNGQLQKSLVQVGDSCYHTSWGMVVLQGEADALVVHTPKSICQVQPAQRQGLVRLTGFLLEKSFMQCSVHLGTPSTKAFCTVMFR